MDTPQVPKAEETLPVLKGGTCYSFSTTNIPKWYQLFCTYYYDKVSDEDENETISWDDQSASTMIKYARKDRSLSLTITLHNSGTVMIQGAKKSLEIWWNEHYPELKSLMNEVPKENPSRKLKATVEDSPTNEANKNVSPSTNVSPTTAETTDPNQESAHAENPVIKHDSTDLSALDGSMGDVSILMRRDDEYDIIRL